MSWSKIHVGKNRVEIGRQEIQPTDGLFASEYEPCEEWEAYTDGACMTDGSMYGGAAYLLVKDGYVVKEVAKGFANTTNNRMEMLAIISAVCAVPAGCDLIVSTDNQYCIDAFMGKYPKATRNLDLINLYSKHVTRLSSIAYVWVRGHAGDPLNERADKLAHDAMVGLMRENGIKCK